MYWNFESHFTTFGVKISKPESRRGELVTLEKLRAFICSSICLYNYDVI